MARPREAELLFEKITEFYRKIWPKVRFFRILQG